MKQSKNNNSGDGDDGDGNATRAERMTSNQARKQPFHYGLINVSDGKCRPQPARLKVCPDYLVLQREEIIFPEDEDNNPVDNKLRTVKLRPQPDGSLGISIKGGTDHNLPILISKVCRNEGDDHVYIGDAVVKVNHVPLASVSHDEAVNVLRNAVLNGGGGGGGGGGEVTLTVKHYRSAAPFLLKNFRQLIPEQDQNGEGDTDLDLCNRRNANPTTTESAATTTSSATSATSTASTTTSTSTSTSDSKGRNESFESARATAATTTTTTTTTPATTPGGAGGGKSAAAAAAAAGSPCSVSSDASSCNNWNGIPKVQRKWVDVVEVPLLMAYITRYIFGTDKLRPNAFEVRGINGANTGVVHSQDLAVLSHWIKLISEYIAALVSLKGAHFNRQFSPTEQISYMSWVAEGVLNRNQPWQNWKPKFFALRGADVCVFEKPPLDMADWSGPDELVQRYKVYEAMFRVIKESENVDERQHCFLIQTAGQESRYFSMETRAELLRLESAWHRTVCSTVSQLGSKTFHVVYKNVPAALTIDWTDGFLLKPFASPGYHFVYSFSQLKNSSDDGNATLRLQFQEPIGSREVVEQTVICPKLQNLLFFMHAFLTAKVASMDPAFLSRGTLS